ncbi:MAG TPA: hemerythrin domain-containing protein [Usitatibacteraceae bacterium]|nr:hemerythrin domain-containing protein [Usitatibacteraceae bacterium]
MSDAIVMLQIEHVHIGRVLNLLEQQLSAGRPSPRANSRLLQGCLEYLSTFPDRCHHPKEELILARLLERNPDLAGRTANLGSDHQLLTLATRTLRRQVEDLQGGAPIDEALAGELREFATRYRNHMYMEEQHFFPLAMKTLSHDELKQIDFSLFDMPDTLFDHGVERRFSMLHGAILRWGAEEQATAGRDSEAAWLAQFTDLLSFNKAMRLSGHNFALQRNDDGSYTLTDEGVALVDIPDCSESRAAWCAHFFLKSRDQARTGPEPDAD